MSYKPLGMPGAAASAKTRSEMAAGYAPVQLCAIVLVVAAASGMLSELHQWALAGLMLIVAVTFAVGARGAAPRNYLALVRQHGGPRAVGWVGSALLLAAVATVALMGAFVTVLLLSLWPALSDYRIGVGLLVIGVVLFAHGLLRSVLLSPTHTRQWWRALLLGLLVVGVVRPFLGEQLAAVQIIFTSVFAVLGALTGLMVVRQLPQLVAYLASQELLPRQWRQQGSRSARRHIMLGVVVLAMGGLAGARADVMTLVAFLAAAALAAVVMTAAAMWRQGAAAKITWTALIVRVGIAATILASAGVAGYVGWLGLRGDIVGVSAGATVIVILVVFVMTQAIYRHYQRVTATLVASERDLVLPSRIHGIVLVSQLNQPSLQALAYARACRLDELEAIVINVDTAQTARVAERWEDRQMPVPLKVIDSPQREVIGPIVDYVSGIMRRSPRDVVSVFVPEFVMAHWWERFLHNRSATQLKNRLRQLPGVMVTSVPWQLAKMMGDAADGAVSSAGEPASAEHTGWFGQVRPVQRPPRRLPRRR